MNRFKSDTFELGDDFQLIFETISRGNISYMGMFNCLKTLGTGVKYPLIDILFCFKKLHVSLPEAILHGSSR